MSADHRRPLVAFFLVAVACALIVTQGVRTNDFFDLIVNRSATSAAVAHSVRMQQHLVADTATGAGDRQTVGVYRSGHHPARHSSGARGDRRTPDRAGAAGHQATGRSSSSTQAGSGKAGAHGKSGRAQARKDARQTSARTWVNRQHHPRGGSGHATLR